MALESSALFGSAARGGLVENRADRSREFGPPRSSRVARDCKAEPAEVVARVFVAMLEANREPDGVCSRERLFQREDGLVPIGLPRGDAPPFVGSDFRAQHISNGETLLREVRCRMGQRDHLL